MIHHVKSDFPDGSRKAGDRLTHAEFQDVKNTPNAYHVLTLPDDAAGRLGMRDLAPNKPIGSAPEMEDATTGFASGEALAAPPPAYVGGAEAEGTILNPSPEERKRDAHPERNSPDIATPAPGSDIGDRTPGKDFGMSAEGKGAAKQGADPAF